MKRLKLWIFRSKLLWSRRILKDDLKQVIIYPLDVNWNSVIDMLNRIAAMTAVLLLMENEQHIQKEHLREAYRLEYMSATETNYYDYPIIYQYITIFTERFVLVAAHAYNTIGNLSREDLEDMYYAEYERLISDGR